MLQHKIWMVIAGLVAFSCQEHSSAEKKIFRYNESSGITSLDPLKATNLPNIWPVQQLYEGLTYIDSNGTLQPALATKWEAFDSMTTYQFTLKPSVFFHDDDCFDGKKRKLTAYDVVYSYQRVLASSSSWILNDIKKDSITGEYAIEVKDSFQLTFKLKQPSFTFPQMLAMPPCAIVCKEAVEKYGADVRRHPVGTGPFLLTAWHENEKLILRKNPNYHIKGLPLIEGISIGLLKDKQTALLEFIRGNLDLLSGIDAAYKDELLTGTGELNEKYKTNIQLQKLPYLNTEYLGIRLDSTSNSPLQNVHIRKALNYALDKTKLITYIRNGIGIPGHEGMVPPALWRSEISHIGYSVNDSLFAIEIKESGYASVNDVPGFTLYADVAYTDVCTYIVHEWNNVGLHVKLEVMDRPTLKSEIAKGNLEFFRASWIADYPDPENYLSLFYGPLESPTGPNYTHYKNRNYDENFKKAKVTGNDNDREGLFYELDKTAMEECSVIILYYDQVVRFTQKRVKGLPPHPMNYLDLRRVCL